ncbi:Ubiquinone/menaquinone biosynthesis C-methyltransferase UbiE [Rhynchospora pubera]|uniref:Ubiquinone/menaquinone biosynthesis C-methyltransferase UbiE n=1 Tax=Rhynchospora pubera TaxID=906938 RepID=A0AAV8D4R2_9POAL|nr:Ubiquinone/menaquinone biosynthesis C-methyltransferase UbiE [Rhynchospora pubera]
MHMHMHGVSVRLAPPPALAPVCSRRRNKCRAQNPCPYPTCSIQHAGAGPTPTPTPMRCCHCRCGRRGLLSASLSLLLPFHPDPPSVFAAPPTDPTAALDRVHPSRPDYYEEAFAKAMSSGMKSYEREIAGYKQMLFSNLRGTSSKRVLELGVGTGPNFKYYANNTALSILGVDPNQQMEKYARSSATTAGLPISNFHFLRGVGEALPVDDDSVDAVIGTLVLCSVKDVNGTLREVKRVLKPGGLYIFIEHVAAEDGTFLRFVQGVLDPLQQVVADGCHLTRETGKQIAGVGFSRLSLNNAFLKSVSLFGPHVYGIACK